MHWIETLFLLFVGHAVADYPLQGDWLAKAKNHKLSLVPGEKIWIGALLSHTLIHAGTVYLITHSPLLAALEFGAHTVIDFAKCDGRLTYNQDQALHIFCKVAWVVIAFAALTPATGA